MKLLPFLTFVAALWSCVTHDHDEKQHEHHGHHAHMRFNDAEKWSKIFDDPARDGWQKPSHVISKMTFTKGMKVADIGAGTGYFLPHLQRAVGSTGIVYGVDIERSLIEHMDERIKKSGWENVKTVLASPDDPKIASLDMDRILIVNTWHHIANRVAYGETLKRYLKKDGSVFVVDFDPSSSKGPKHGKMKPGVVAEELQKAGFKAEILQEELPDQYIIKATKVES